MADNGPLAIAAFCISVITFLFNMIWSPFQKARSEQIKLSLDLRSRYTLQIQQHLDTLYIYKEKHEPNYYLDWQSNYHPDDDNGSAEKDVGTALRILGNYWNELLECYESGALPSGSWLPTWVPRGPFWVPRDMLSGNFLRRAEDYMRLAEPLDCANWYRLGIPEQKYKKDKPEKKGDYRGDHPLRPGRYKKIEAHLSQDVREEWHNELQAYARACKDNLTCPEQAQPF